MGLGPTVDRTCGLGPERGVDLEGDVEDVVPGAGLDELFGLSEQPPLPSLAGWMLSAGWVQVRSGAAEPWPEKTKGRRDVLRGLRGPWSLTCGQVAHRSLRAGKAGQVRALGSGSCRERRCSNEKISA